MSIVYNKDNKILGLPPHYYRKMTMPPQPIVTSIDESLYTSNLGPLHTYTGVCWNQMSDQPSPSIQPRITGSNSLKGTIISSKPGSQTPGGAGCDIKHNSYDRYLNRLKGKELKPAILKKCNIKPTNRYYNTYVVDPSNITHKKCIIENNCKSIKTTDTSTYFETLSQLTGGEYY
jgi:hypothetical protein